MGSLRQTQFSSSQFCHGHPPLLLRWLLSDVTQSIHLCFGLLLLLLAVPTLLWGRCGRHNSPPASSVVDILLRCSDGSHVRCHTIYPSLFWSSSSSPGRCHLQCSSSHIFLFSSLYMPKPPQSRFRDPVCDLLYLHSLLDVLISQSLSVWPHAHLHIFISATSNLFTWALVTGTVSIP